MDDESMLDELDPLRLDRKLREARAVWVQWRRALRSGHGYEFEPLLAYRAVSGRTLFQRLRDLGDRDPLAPALARWVYRLAEQRINAEALSALEFERRGRTHVIEAPEHAQSSLSEMLERALTEAPRRAAWLEAFMTRAETLAAYGAVLWERRAEIARRMGIESPDTLELCNPDIASVAAQWLSETRDMADAFRRSTPSGYVELSLGHDFDKGWPSRLGLRQLAESFRDTRLFDGLRLVTGDFPEAVAGSSFLRGLLRLGAAWAEAAAPPHQPFVIAHDAYGLRERTAGALFAGLGLSPSFSRKALGFSVAQARERTRAVARVVLLFTRAGALRVSLRAPALLGRSTLTEAFENGVAETFGFGLRGALAGSLFRLEVDDAQRFAGLLLAAAETERLVNQHDEDWFRNPRSVDQLRSEAELSPETACTTVELELGRRALLRVLREALG